MSAEIRRLLEGLRPFLRHSDGCGALVPPYSYCSCGLHFAFDAALLAAPAPQPQETKDDLSRVDRLTLSEGQDLPRSPHPDGSLQNARDTIARHLEIGRRK